MGLQFPYLGKLFLKYVCWNCLIQRELVLGSSLRNLNCKWDLTPAYEKCAPCLLRWWSQESATMEGFTCTSECDRLWDPKEVFPTDQGRPHQEKSLVGFFPIRLSGGSRDLCWISFGCLPFSDLSFYCLPLVYLHWSRERPWWLLSWILQGWKHLKRPHLPCMSASASETL